MSEVTTIEKPDLKIDQDEGNFSYPEDYAFDAGTGLTEKTIDYICDVKEDPDWVREFRKKALRIFREKPLPTHWASKDLENIHFDDFRYYLSRNHCRKR